MIISFSSATAAPGSFTYQGQIVKPNGQPLEESSVTFTLQLFSPGAEECLLYEETHSINMSDSNGIFAINVGEGSRDGAGDYEDTATLSTALANTGGAKTPIDTCAIGNSYTPTVSDSRFLRVTFTDSTGPNTLAQDHKIVSVPYSDSASSIDGLLSSDILQVNTGGSNVLTQSNLENIFDGANHTELLALIGGTSTQYLSGTPTADFDVNSNRVVNVATPTGANDAANKAYVDGNLGQSAVGSLVGIGTTEAGHVLTWNGTQWTNTAPSTTDNTKLPLTGGTLTGNLDLGSNDISNVNDLSVGNNVTVTGSVSANGVSSSGTVALFNGGNFVAFQAPAGASDVIWTLPGADGTANQFLQTNGAGVLTWADATPPVDSVFGRTGAVVAADGDYDATTIINTPNGDIAANRVQGAIDELDAEKVSLAGDTMTGDLRLNTNSEIRFSDADNSDYVGFVAPNNIIGGSFVWTLPAADGANGEVLSTDNAGNLSWISPVPADNSINTAKINDGAVTTPKLADNAVTTAKLDSNAVGTSNIADNAITSGKINDGAVVAADIANNAVTSSKILDNAVSSSKIANSAIDNSKLANNSVTTAKIVNGTITDVDIDGSAGIAATKIASGSVDNTEFGYLDGLSSSIQTQISTNATNISGKATLGGDAGAVVIGSNDDTLSLEANNSEAIRILANGNVGIGTTIPSEELDVVGDFEIMRSDQARAYRFRTSGGQLDVDFFGRDFLLSGFTSANYGGTQNYYLRFHDDSHTASALGNWTFRQGSNFADTTTGAVILHVDSSVGKVGIGTTSPDTMLEIVGTLKIADGLEGCSVAGDGGMIRYNGTDLQFCNGSSWQTLGVSGAGLTSLNGQTGTSQTFAAGAAGNSPAIVSGTNVHTLNVPLASAGGTVTSGTISNADYVSFSNKLDAVAGSTLADGNVFVGNGSNQAAAVAIGGDATLANDGTLSLAANSVDTAELVDNSVTSIKISDNAVTSAKISDGTITDGDINASAGITATKIAGGLVDNTEFGYLDGLTSSIQTQISTNATNIATNTTNINGKATLGGDAGAVVLGSNDNTLSLEANNSEAVRILANGNVGIGTATPGQKLDVEGRILSGAAGTLTGETGSLLMEELAANESAPGVYEKTGFRSPDALSADLIYTLPSVAPTAGQFLQSDASGLLSWASMSGADNLGNHTATTALNLDDNTIINLNSGAEATPSFSFNSDSDTGIWSETADKINFSTGGTEALSMDAAGQISIGLDSPSVPAMTAVDSLDDAALYVVRQRDSIPVGAYGTLIGLGNSRYPGGFAAGVATKHFGGDPDTGGLVLMVNSTSGSDYTLDEAISINSNSNVGIGDTNPSYKLEVNGSITNSGSIDSHINITDDRAYSASPVGGISFTTQFRSNGSETVVAGLTGGKENTSDINYAGYLALHTRQHGSLPEERLRVASSGNVGIGTTTPDTILEIVGTLKIADGLEACSAAADGGMIRYNGTDLQFCNGSSWQTLGVSGAGLTSLNGQTGSSQTFAAGAAGNSPAITSGTNVHTLNVPLASAGGTVTSGTISNADYVSFSNKLDSVVGATLPDGNIWVGNGSNQAAAVPMSGDGSLANDGSLVINANAIDSGKIADNSIVDADIASNAAIDVVKIAGGSVDNTEFGFLDGVTSSIQTQLGNKLEASDISGKATLGGDAGAVTIGSNNSTLSLEANNTEIIRLRTDGSVAIGSTYSAHRLRVYRNDNSFNFLSVDNPNSGAGAAAGIQLYNDNDGAQIYKASTNVGGEIANDLVLNSGWDLGGDITFLSGGAQTAVIKGSGNIGIGTTGPFAKLHIEETVNNSVGIIVSNPSAGADADTGILLVSNTAIGNFSLYGPNAVPTGMIQPNQLTLEAAGNNPIAISTSGTGAVRIGTNNIERVRVDSSGNVGIGITNPSHIFHINGQGRSTNSAWATTSDARLKDIQSVYEYGLDEIARLKTYRFNYKENNFYDLPSDTDFMGVMAQELVQTIPEAVEKDSNGYYTVNTDPIFWANINAVKELNLRCQATQSDLERIAKILQQNKRDIASVKEENKKQQEEIELLKKENQDLRDRLERIEEMLLKDR